MDKKDLHFKLVPITCSFCGKELIHKGNGYYICPECRELYQDDFAKIAAYLTEHPEADLTELKQRMAVSNELLQNLSDSGQLNMDFLSPKIRHCHSCGREILFGRYCETCRIMTGNAIKDAFQR